MPASQDSSIARTVPQSSELLDGVAAAHDHYLIAGAQQEAARRDAQAAHTALAALVYRLQVEYGYTAEQIADATAVPLAHIDAVAG